MTRTTNERPTRNAGWTKVAMWVGLAALAYLVWMQARGRVHVVSAEDAPPAPPLVLFDGTDDPLELRELLGQVVVINLWAEWCGPCRREIPAINDVHERLAPEGLVVLGLSDDPPEAGTPADLRSRNGIAYPVVRALEPLRGPFSGTRVIPHTWIVDREGRVRVSHRGVLTRRALMRACQDLLDERPSDASAPAT